MKKNLIENSLIQWFDEMLKKYADVSFKYEYNEKRHVYLVSYTVTGDEYQEVSFFQDIMIFEDKMDLLFENDAPLFCEDESLFKLSDNAILISNSKFNNQERLMFNWLIQSNCYYNTDSFGNFLMAA